MLKPGPPPGCEKRVPEVCLSEWHPRKGPEGVKDKPHLAGRKSVLAVGLILASDLLFPLRTNS